MKSLLNTKLGKKDLRTMIGKVVIAIAVIIYVIYVLAQLAIFISREL